MTMDNRFSVSTRHSCRSPSGRIVGVAAHHPSAYRCGSGISARAACSVAPHGGHELSLLARLVRTEAAAPSGMWADETRAIAGPDQAPLVRAQQAASLAGVGRAVYDALLERIVEADDKRETSTRHRDHLAAVVEEHGPVAAKLDVDALEADIGALPPKLRIVLTATKAWIASKSGNPAPLFDVYAAAEARKGPRARLALTPERPRTAPRMVERRTWSRGATPLSMGAGQHAPQ